MAVAVAISLRLPRHLILLGTAGAGKSTLAEMFAKHVSCDLIKLDDEIVKIAGKNIEEIFNQDGEKHFRDLEEQTLRDALAKPAAVIDPGGGIVDRPANHKLMQASESDRCYLHVAVAVLLARIGDDDSRPMYRGGDLEQRLRELLERRQGFFRKVATCEVEVADSQSAQTTFERICVKLDWCKQLT